MDMKKKSYPVTVEKVQKPLTISNVKSMNENKANNSTPKAKWNNMSKDTTAKSVSTTSSQETCDVIQEGQGESEKKESTKGSKRHGNPGVYDATTKRSKVDEESLAAARNMFTTALDASEDEDIEQGWHDDVIVQGGLDISSVQDSTMLFEINRKVDVILSLLQGGGVAVKEENAELMVNDVNLLKIPAKDVYSYGRSLLDLLFTKEEQKSSVVFKTKKSEKPPLSPRRVEKMFACIQKKYGKDWDNKKLLSSLGQKCRDAKLDKD